MILTETVHSSARLGRVRSGQWELLSDPDLVRAAVEDLDAFAELVRRHQSFVFSAALRIVRNRTEAEDLAQETFLRAFHGLRRFRNDASVRSWLYRIASNLAINAVTRRREYAQHDIPDRPDFGSSPGSDVENAALRAQLQESIAELPEDLRVVLVLREADNLSYQEIAERAGIPLNTVRTRILRGRRALGKKMEAWR